MNQLLTAGFEPINSADSFAELIERGVNSYEEGDLNVLEHKKSILGAYFSQKLKKWVAHQKK